MKKKDKANILFNTALNKKIPNKTQRVNFITDLLEIEKEAVYRRLRGEVPFTISEVSLIAQRLGISIDELIGLQLDRRKTFYLQLSDFAAPQDSDYLMWESYNETLKNLNETGNLCIYETWDSLPFPLCYKFNNLTCFYIFKWAFQVNNDLTATKLEDIKLEDRFKNLIQNNLNQYLAANKTQLILADNMFENLIKDLRFFHNIHLINKTDIQTLTHEMERFLNYLEELAYEGVYPETGNKVLLYISEINMQTPYSLLETEESYISIIRTLTLAGISTTEEATFNYIINWFNALKRLSTHISISGEKDRIRYFEKQRKIINDFKQEINSQSQKLFNN